MAKVWVAEETSHVAVQFAQGFAAYAFATLKVHLRWGKVYCAVGERTFLENPAALVERNFYDVLAEVVNGLVNVKPFIISALDCHIRTLEPGVKEPIALVGSSTCGEDAIGTAKNGFHLV